MSQNLIEGPIIGYKAMNDDMTCMGYKFELGKLHEIDNDDDLVMCENGFHFCEQPSGVWSYYNSGRMFKVEAYDVLGGVFEPGADYKRVCRRIKIIEEVATDENWNTGDGNTGDGNTGDKNTGNRNTGDRNTGNWNTGDGNTGGKNTGDGNTGNWNTGDRNTGNWNTGNWNTGDGNTGDGNTGDGNTGDGNTGGRNTGDGNATDYSPGFFCKKEQPIIMFDKETDVKREDLDLSLISRLSQNLSMDDPFDVSPFLCLPNATKGGIKSLHKAHIKKRKENEE